ncbi:hypothetical protein EYF80_012989 [Liparis tanakae]|uniref:Uncharacterized protein n=1 Tax=Liparis tanakae TaxID=230148 RepID=A0A4Z2IFQ5_9TELE|nr:hypothetical protein EYF80_012989 [Liparis tanakae]
MEDDVSGVGLKAALFSSPLHQSFPKRHVDDLHGAAPGLRTKRLVETPVYRSVHNGGLLESAVIKGAFPEDDGASPVGGVGLAPANRRARGARCRPQLIDESGGDDKPKKGPTCCCAVAKRRERRLTDSKPPGSSSTRVPPIEKP